MLSDDYVCVFGFFVVYDLKFKFVFVILFDGENFWFFYDGKLCVFCICD